MELNQEALAKRAMDTFVKTLDDMEWKYDIDPDDEFRLETGGIGDDMPIHLVIRTDPQRLCLSLLSPIDVTVPEEKGVDVAFALAIINDDLSMGNFDFHMENGSIWFRMCTLYRDMELTQELCGYFLMLAVHVVDKYNDKLMMLVNGLMDLHELFDFVNDEEAE